ncbi:MAG: large-conductance mechanosensitive channel protein MscL [Bacilli bacterium]|nr:large-conductance mechanosensitive channel protein MscL [Bacilli bacterium]MDD4283146.1 large-conductance mechanosensitive channel protein MscL [Bacilli bacterium]MDD4719122.1 large-conductance mechanosensitive channel protein MscL [Bacilli bacterium]
MLKDFKKFISRGNVLDLAVGVIIGGAFGKIVSSLVNDIIMPSLGILLGGLDFTSLSIIINDSVITYGIFIQNIVDFLLIAASIFLMIRIINNFKKKEEEKVEVVEAKPTTEQLLEEIRDLLKK